jgi:CRISPR-associated endoribonuclease Cas6
MKLSKYRFTIKPENELILPPYKGSTLRGGFGRALKYSVCIEGGRECIQCVHRYKCIYSYVFETPVPREEKESKRSKDEYVPHPFVIEPPIDKRQFYGIEDKLDFHLILVGRAIDYIPYIIFAFEELGRLGIGKDRGKYSLEKVISINNDREILIYDNDSHIRDDFYVIDSTELFRDATQLNYQQVTFHFLTPTRIKNKGKLTIDIDFVIILRNLLRRLSRLAQVHCDEKWELEWKELIEMANDRVSTVSSGLKWHDWKRYSQRQGTKMKMGGFLGEITLEGEFAEFMPFIKLGELLHMGKGTVYGLGKYEIKGE